MKINDFVKRCHENAKEHGFWDQPRETGTLIALIHSEGSAALDAGSCAEFCEELADIAIRIGDLCGGLGIDLEESIQEINEILKDDPDLKTGVSIESLDAMKKSLEPIMPDLDDYKSACGIHSILSSALEMDRQGDKSGFAIYLALAFMGPFDWAGKKGYDLIPAIIQKMEKNKERPRLHDKKY